MIRTPAKSNPPGQPSSTRRTGPTPTAPWAVFASVVGVGMAVYAVVLGSVGQRVADQMAASAARAAVLYQEAARAARQVHQLQSAFRASQVAIRRATQAIQQDRQRLRVLNHQLAALQTQAGAPPTSPGRPAEQSAGASQGAPSTVSPVSPPSPPTAPPPVHTVTGASGTP